MNQFRDWPLRSTNTYDGVVPESPKRTDRYDKAKAVLYSGATDGKQLPAFVPWTAQQLRAAQTGGNVTTEDPTHVANVDQASPAEFDQLHRRQLLAGTSSARGDGTSTCTDSPTSTGDQGGIAPNEALAPQETSALPRAMALKA